MYVSILYMSYKFKNIDISVITDTIGGSNNTVFANNYAGLPSTVQPNYPNSTLLTQLGYTVAGHGDLSTVCSARHYVYNVGTWPVAKPDGANQFRYFIIGGSGGGGGGGGCANNSGVQGNGGAGGNGGVGNTTEGKDYISQSSIKIEVGSGGAGGSGGPFSRNNTTGVDVYGGGGNSGSGGQPTKIYDANGQSIAISNGGAGGNGGQGGYAYWSNFYKNKSFDGSSGNSGGNYIFNSTNWNPNYVRQQTAGYSGNGGFTASQPGNWGGGGQDGYAVIVWLYD
jgi:hypothetical protein